MKTLYLDCGMGAAGDMLMAALLELIPTPDSFVTKLNYLGIPDVQVSRQQAVRCGITGTHLSVTVGGVEESEEQHGHTHSHGGHSHAHAGDEQQHEHGSYEAVLELLDSLPVSDWVREQARAVYALIAEAESRAHGVPVAQVHFHEVGSMDAVADIVGVCMLLEELAPEQIVASPVHLGCGQVRCAHGILPVPAPATADILRGVPVYGGEVKGELCTPTGAALLKHFVSSFGDMPTLTVQAIGYGMGSKEFPRANCLRAMLGEQGGCPATNDSIVELSCNLDDMTGEAVGFALGKLLAAGALDAYTIPIQMKKNRPGVMLVCLAKPEQADALATVLLRHTTTFGVRRTEHTRYMLQRSIRPVNTRYGRLRVKTGEGYGVRKQKLEYEDVAAAAETCGASLAEVLQALE